MRLDLRLEPVRHLSLGGEPHESYMVTRLVAAERHLCTCLVRIVLGEIRYA
jgi:hypothetical protein